MILTERFKRWLFVFMAAHFWGLTVFLAVLDADDGKLGLLINFAELVAILAATFSVLAWLQWHLPSLTSAFEVGVSVGEIKHEHRPTVLTLPRQQE